MSTIMLWVVGAVLIITNLAMRAQIRQLEACLRALRDPKEQLLYLRQQAAYNDKMAALKALRKKHPELSLTEANQLWQQI